MNILDPQLNRNWMVWFPTLPQDIHDTLSQNICETTLPTIGSSAQSFGLITEPLHMTFALDETGTVLKALTHLLNRDTAYMIDLLNGTIEEFVPPSARFWVSGYATAIDFDSLDATDNNQLRAYVTFSYDQLEVNGIPMAC